jgi:hypothetical protein
MMATPQPPSWLVIALCRALADATADGKAPYWLSIFGAREALGVTMEELDAAVAYAIANGLVRTDGAPAHALAVTNKGIELARRP